MPNLNDLLNVVLNANSQTQQQQQANKIKLPTLPPNIVPLTEKELQSLLYQTSAPPPPPPNQQQQVQSSAKTDTASGGPLLSQLPLPSLDTSSKDLQQQMLKFEQQQQQQQQNAHFSNQTQPQQLSQMQQMQKLQQLMMNQPNNFINDFQNLTLLNQQQQQQQQKNQPPPQLMMQNQQQNQQQQSQNQNIQMNYSSRSDSNNNSNSSSYKSNFLKGTNIDIENIISENESGNEHSSSFTENMNNNIDIYQYISDKHYMPGTASLIEDVDKQLMVILRDGKTLIGYLRSIDQYANLLLSNTIERIYVGNKYGDIPRGVYIVRGENVVLIGEVDFTLPNKVEMIKIDYNEILELQQVEQKKLADIEKNKKKALLNRCLMPQSDSILDDYY